MKMLPVFFLLVSILFSNKIPEGNFLQHRISTNTLYYQKLSLYGSKDKIKEIVNSQLFKGKSEIITLEKIQRILFYKVPELLEPLANYQKGCFVLQESIKNNQIRKIITRKETGFKLFLLYDHSKKIIEKRIFLHNELIEKTLYFYKGKTLIFAKSDLYGYKYFTSPKNIFEKGIRFFRGAL